MFRYRDSKTGWFVKESTYNRSVSHGGTRYIKEEIKPKEEPEEPEEEPEEGYDEEPEWEDWAITFSYGGE